MYCTRFLSCLSLALLMTACSGSSDSLPAQTPTPVLPEPTLITQGQVLAYAHDGKPLGWFPESESVTHEMTVGKTVVRLRTPKGWSAHDAGAVWLENPEYPQARFVIYPTREHEQTFRTEWRDRDVQDKAETVSPIHVLDSPRRPYLYTYRRNDDGRCGIVYALLTEAGRADSGIIVHGIWPAEYDRQLRPAIVAMANGVSVSVR